MSISPITMNTNNILNFWSNLSIRWKLTILLVVAGGLPVLIVTQVNSQFTRTSYLENLKITLKEKGSLFTSDFVQWGLDEAKNEAETIAKSVQGEAVDLSEPAQVGKNRAFLQSLLQVSSTGVAPESIKNFKLITNAQGRTVAQIAQVIDQDFAVNSKLMPLGEVSPPAYKVVKLPTGIAIADLEIVKQSLSTGKPQSGTELVKSSTLKSLGLANQAAIAPRLQATQGLASGKAPSPEGTFDIEGGKIGLANIAVSPIIINGRVVGTVVVGGLLNRNYGIPEGFQKKLNIPVATIFAQDFRVNTSVPYIDPVTKKPDGTRAIGTRASEEIAKAVLKNRQTFVGDANIVGLNYLTYYQPLFDHQDRAIGIAFIGKSLGEIEKDLNTLIFQSYVLGLGSVILIGLLAGFLANAISKPLTKLSDFSRAIAEGNFSKQLEQTSSRDEIGILNTEMQKMAVDIQSNFQSSKLQLAIADSAKTSQDINLIFNLAVTGAKEILGADRVVIYKFNENGGGTIIAEAVSDGLPKALNDEIEDACISQDLIEAYKKGRVVPTQDVFNAGFHPDHLNLMKRLAIKSNLVTPVVTEERLLGLLIAHFCHSTHQWQDSEVSTLRQLALQLGLAIERVNFLQTQKLDAEQQKQQKEILQNRAMELLIEVDPISRGDLTVRAQVTEDEIGTIADSYNATVRSLREIVTQVQTASQQVLATTNTSEISIQSLSTEALRQAAEITIALQKVAEMSDSIQGVTSTAIKAEAAIDEANTTVKEGEAAMNRTVEEFTAIRNIVAETTEKVERLSESSQKISQIVNLIGSFAAQTNILALNASMEAARAGEEGRGFAVVADEVRSLARQSAKATNEIEKLVTEIQTQTKDLATAMQLGAKQAASGTQTVEIARQSLDKIALVSSQINGLVEAIAQATVTQAQTSESVAQTMNNVAMIADNTSGEAIHVVDGFKQLLALAQQLQSSVGRFKVN